MASVKVKFRPSSIDGKEGSIYYQVIHKRVERENINRFSSNYSKYGTEELSGIGYKPYCMGH